jgi:peroxiredoxin
MRGVLIGLIAFAASPRQTGESPQSQYEALAKDFDTAVKAAAEEYSKATTEEGRMTASLKRPRTDEFARRFFALAEKYPQDPVAIDALTWIASKCLFGPQAEKALNILARDHSRSARLKDYCGSDSLYGEPFSPYEEMLRAVLKDNPHREVRARACVTLADYLKMAKETTEKHLVGDSRLLPRPSSSRANFDRIKQRGLDKVAAESAALFEEVLAKYADVVIENSYPSNAADFARGRLYELRNLGIGAKAPEIDGRDIHGKPMKLSEYRGKVVVLDFGSHRSCGVCRQMYPHLRNIVEDYKGRPVALLGISVDDDVKELRVLAEKGETTWAIWWDGENAEGPIAAQWVVHAMPTFYVLDQRGVIRNKGFLQADQIRSTVDILLKEMGADKP